MSKPVENRMNRLLPRREKIKEKNIHVCIISWTGKHANAMTIYEAIKITADKVSIVYSDQDPNFVFPEEYSSIKTSNQLFWADKFKAAISSSTAEILLVIHADCSCADWDLVVAHCKHAFVLDEELGMWAPKTTGTSFPGEVTKILQAADGKMFYVAYIDGIVFAMNRKIVERMKQLDYSKNIYGWGIDWFASAYAQSEGMRLMMDNTISVNHPPERGYDGAAALSTISCFMIQMELKEKIQHKLILSYIKYRKGMLANRSGGSRGKPNNGNPPGQ